MRTRLTWRGWLISGALCCFIALTGCSSQTRGRLLHVFFTGVDQPASSTPEGTISQVTNAVPNTADQIPAAPLYIHQPYAEQNCSACHLGALSQDLRPGGAAICLECHPKLKEKAKYVHAPFGDGSCSLCHAPHQSEEPRLLTAKGQGVCLDCHELPQISSLKGHEEMGSNLCWNCHDPHRSEQKYLLKAAK